MHRAHSDTAAVNPHLHIPGGYRLCCLLCVCLDICNLLHCAEIDQGGAVFVNFILYNIPMFKTFHRIDFIFDRSYLVGAVANSLDFFHSNIFRAGLLMSFITAMCVSKLV